MRANLNLSSAFWRSYGQFLRAVEAGRFETQFPISFNFSTPEDKKQNTKYILEEDLVDTWCDYAAEASRLRFVDYFAWTESVKFAGEAGLAIALLTYRADRHNRVNGTKEYKV